jgi:Flp pilus assembly protein TadG
MRVLLRLLRSFWQQEFGQGLVLSALAMVAVLGVTAMAVDVGLFLHEKRELQNAADAAALAGVQELPNSPGDAEQKAGEWAVNNGIGSGELEDIEVSTTYVANDTITVQVKRDVPFVFARVLGFSGDTTRADATARVGSPTIGTGAMPWGLRESYKEWAEAQVGFGQPVVLMESASGGASGAFGALCLDGEHCGADVYRDVVEEGAEVDLEEFYFMKTGVIPGPTEQGLDARFTGESEECDTFDEVFVEVGEDDWAFRSNTCNPWAEEGSGSRRVVLAPVIPDYYFDECGGTSCLVEGSAFSMLFLDDPSMCVTPEHPDEPLVCGRFLRASFDIGFLIGAYDPDTDIRFVRLVE